MKNKISLFIVGLILFGCSTTIIKKEDVSHPAESTSSASLPPVVTASRPPVLAAPKPAGKDPIYTVTTAGGSLNILYKSFLLPTINIDNKNFINFVYFPRKPITKKEVDQYVFICKVWSNSLPSKEEASAYVEKENLIPLYWSLTKATNPDICEELVSKYDYTRMKVLVTKNKLDNTKIQLLGIYNNVYVSMNLTKITKEEDIILAFDVWRKKMSRVPEKSSDIDIFTMVDSAKKVLGVLAGLIITGFKG